MSGEMFDYKELWIDRLADELEVAIFNEEIKIKDKSPWCYSKDTIKLMKKVHRRLREDYIYVKRLAYVLSGDDGEEQLIPRINEDLEELKKRPKYNGEEDV